MIRILHPIITPRIVVRNWFKTRKFILEMPSRDVVLSFKNTIPGPIYSRRSCAGGLKGLGCEAKAVFSCDGGTCLGRSKLERPTYGKGLSVEQLKKV